MANAVRNKMPDAPIKWKIPNSLGEFNIHEIPQLIQLPDGRKWLMHDDGMY